MIIRSKITQTWLEVLLYAMNLFFLPSCYVKSKARELQGLSKLGAFNDHALGLILITL